MYQGLQSIYSVYEAIMYSSCSCLELCVLLYRNLYNTLEINMLKRIHPKTYDEAIILSCLQKVSDATSYDIDKLDVCRKVLGEDILVTYINDAGHEFLFSFNPVEDNVCLWADGDKRWITL